MLRFWALILRWLSCFSLAALASLYLLIRKAAAQWKPWSVATALRHLPLIVGWAFITASRWRNAGLLQCCTGKASPPQVSPAHCAPRMFPFPAGWLTARKGA